MISQIDFRQAGGNFLFWLLLFAFAIDPTNTILRIKDVAFVLLFGYNLLFYRAEWGRLAFFIIPESIVVFSYFVAVAGGFPVDDEFVTMNMKALLPLTLLPWVHHYDVCKLAVWPATLAALTVVVLFWIILIVPEVELPLYYFMQEYDKPIMMTNRYFLGMKFFFMYLKSTAAFLPVLGLAFYSLLKVEKGKWVSLFIIAVLLHNSLVSGTRMTILFPFLILGLITYHFYHKRRYYNYVIYPTLFLAGVAFFGLVWMLATETTEASNAVKYAHLTSYKDYFNEHPLALVLGQGVGAEFYSKGFRSMTLQTEWTYIEFVRYFGVLALPFLFVFLYPVYRLWKLGKYFEICYPLLYAYLTYLLVAGTNPLLVSSTGMFTLYMLYSKIYRLEAELTV